MAPRRRTTIRGRALLVEVDLRLSEAQDALSNVVNAQMASWDATAYELGNEMYFQIEKMRRRILKLTTGIG